MPRRTTKPKEETPAPAAPGVAQVTETTTRRYVAPVDEQADGYLYNGEESGPGTSKNARFALVEEDGDTDPAARELDDLLGDPSELPGWTIKIHALPREWRLGQTFSITELEICGEYDLKDWSNRLQAIHAMRYSRQTLDQPVNQTAYYKISVLNDRKQFKGTTIRPVGLPLNAPVNPTVGFPPGSAAGQTPIPGGSFTYNIHNPGPIPPAPGPVADPIKQFEAQMALFVRMRDTFAPLFQPPPATGAATPNVSLPPAAPVAPADPMQMVLAQYMLKQLEAGKEDAIPARLLEGFYGREESESGWVGVAKELAKAAGPELSSKLIDLAGSIFGFLSTLATPSALRGQQPMQQQPGPPQGQLPAGAPPPPVQQVTAAQAAFSQWFQALMMSVRQQFAIDDVLERAQALWQAFPELRPDFDQLMGLPNAKGEVLTTEAFVAQLVQINPEINAEQAVEWINQLRSAYQESIQQGESETDSPEAQ